MAQLTDTQAILLSTASQRDDLNLRPLPTTLKASGGITKAIASLVKAGLVEERDGNSFATVAGLAAIGVEPEQNGDDAAADATETTPPAPPARTTKAALLIGLLEREGGATLQELIAATGWLPHTTRAALTGLRKKGHVIERGKRDGQTCYRIVVAG